MKLRTYADVVQLLNRTTNYETVSHYSYKRSISLSQIKKVLKLLGHPEIKTSFLHIAGTNGKGSTAFYLEKALLSSGYNVGLYTSPHLNRLTERVKVGGRDISTKELVSSFQFMMKKISLKELLRLTYFEMLTVFSFVFFSEQKVDLAILETGMGGRLDATNVVKPLLSVMSPIGFDHMEQLGNTLRKIASEKAGIIKRGVPVVSSVQQKEVREVLISTAKENKAPIYFIRSKKKEPFLETNQRLALKCLKLLSQNGFSISKQVDQSFFQNLRIPGRFEIFQQKATVILDGAHNEMALQKLFLLVREKYPQRKIHVLLAIAKDKDTDSIKKLIESFPFSFYLTKTRTKRALDPEEFIHTIKGENIEIVSKQSRKAFLALLSKLTSKELLLVTGSLYLVGEIRPLLVEKKDAEN